MPMFIPKEHAAYRRPIAAACLVGTLLLGGCAHPVPQAVAVVPTPEDYHLRHPVVLANAPRELDVFFVGLDGRLDAVQTQQLQAFARDALAQGQSGISVAVPEGAVDHVAAERTVGAVRRALLRLGLKGAVRLTGYPVQDPALASPLRLSFLSLQARPTTQCGQWPADLGSGDLNTDWNNRSYYNLGCASQQTLAAQIADPRDLVTPHALDPTDVQLRTRAIGSLRGTNTQGIGIDPSTRWSSQPNLIGPVGGF